MDLRTRYTRLGDSNIAYQVVGSGPPDLVFSAGAFATIDAIWDDPAAALFLRRLASFSRLIRFDRLGIGVSDPLPLDALPPLESFADELEAVMDAVGSDRAVVLGALDAGPMAVLYATTRPERVSGLLLSQTAPRFLGDEGYPGPPQEVFDQLVKTIEEAWGTESMAPLNAPSRAGDERFASWYARYTRSLCSPRTLSAYLRALLAIDVRPLLKTVQHPTLVMHRSEYPFVPLEQAKFLAEHIEGAAFVEIPGSDGPLFWQEADLIVRTIQGFVEGLSDVPVPVERQLATVMFTDIVRSTELASERGDREWRAILDTHDEVVRRRVEAEGGQLVKSTGDGALATFDGPGRAIRCVVLIRRELRNIGLEIRAGIHTGEVEVRGPDVGGVAAHLAARVLSRAQPGEILVSRTVRDLVVGSDFDLQARGEHTLKGFKGSWELFAVTGASA